LSEDVCKRERSNAKIICKDGGLTLTLYKHSPRLLNVTGIKREADIDGIIQHIENKYKQKCIKHQIDSIMISHKDYKSLKMNDLLKNAESCSDIYYIDYNPELFTGIYLKPFLREYPTINLFYSGSYQLLGGQSFSRINESLQIIKRIIERSENGLF